MKIFTTKTKVMAFRGKEPLRTKIIINDQILEQVSLFNNLGNYIGYDRNYDIAIKLDNFQRICGTVNRIFRSKVRRDIKLESYKVMAVPVPVSYTHLDVYKRQVL